MGVYVLTKAIPIPIAVGCINLHVTGDTGTRGLLIGIGDICNSDDISHGSRNGKE